MIKCETVILLERTKTGEDDFGAPIYEETETPVKNVVVGSPSFEAVTQDVQLFGKRLAFILGIPKGDTHDWKDRNIIIRGQMFRTYGFPLLQTEANVPGRWNLQVKVEAYE